MTTGTGWPHEPVDTRARHGAVAVAEPVVLSVREAEPEPAEPPVPPVRPRAFVLLVVTLTVAVILGAFAVVDWWTRNRELDVLLDRIVAAEAAQRPMHQAQLRLQQACAFTPDSCDLSRLQVAAHESLPELRRTGEAVAGTSVVRFHGSIRELRDRYLDHNQAWVAWLDGLVAGTAGAEQPDAIRDTWYAAGDAARAAVPPFALGDAHDRVTTIFHL